MSMKKWLVFLGIVGLLTFAFFWGGNSPKSSNKSAVSSVESQAIHMVTSTPIPDRQQEEKQGAISLSTEDPYQKDTINQTDAPQGTQPVQEAVTPPIENLSKTDTSSIETDKKPENTESRASDKTINPQTNDQPAAEPSKPDTSTQPVVASKDSEPKKDKYLTDPVPEGKPKPVEWQDVTINKKKTLTATLSVTSKTILDNMSIFNKDKLEVLPADGVIYKAQTVTFYEGESVFNVLLREMQKNKIHMEFTMTPIYNSNYIEGIHNLYEFDCGELSGWMYKVNGWFPNYGSSRYILKEGDVIDWVYTCDLGRDVGGGKAAGGAG
ncbi:protein of unknown function [Paenibacillus sp. 1_12]|uniref:DUF4430 domain-containing protein n=1 Tax=Paenibacillus sp. 1_12 TaxID=1566278 RepID=UPI0008EDDE3E|nr:DUF4430 domain-containing protein [Paenibacillus sp. 1_12]SFM26936.1 protein of unknown function [Paenibacillus sp. 1_12]